MTATQTNREPQKAPEADVYTTNAKWGLERPRILVVACSDGRYQEALDEFLNNRLGILDYDRFYAPGGPGALVPSVISYFRGIQFQDDAKFLVDAHGLERVILIVHGPDLDGGPPEAGCADYKRKMPGYSPREIRNKQHDDLNEVYRLLLRHAPQIEMQVFVAEVRADRRVQFVPVPIREEQRF